MLISIAYGQSTGYLRYDSVRMEKVGGNSELILLNGSRDSVGPLYNMGNGRTRFRTFNGLGIPNRQELQDTAAALRASAKRFGIEDNIQTADRSFDQAGFKFQFPGTVNNNEFIVGDSLSGSTARFQVSTGTTKRPVIAAGNPVSNAAVYLFASTDTTEGTGTASAAAVRTFGMLASRRIVINHTPVTLTSKYGTYTGIEIRPRAGDSVKLAPANNDLFNGFVADLGFQGRSDFPGRKVIQSGSFVTDASSAIIGDLDLTTTPGNNFRLRGDYAAVTGFIRDVTNPNGDTLDRFYNFMATGGGALAPHIFKAYNFRGGVISSFVDTLIGIYIDPQNTGVNFNYLGAPLMVGTRDDQVANNQLPLSSAILQVESKSKVALLPRFPFGTGAAAITSPPNGGIYFNRDSANYFFYDSTAATWRAFYNTGGGTTSPAGNQGNIQIKNGTSFGSPASDSLTFTSSGLNVKGSITSSVLTSGRFTIAGASGVLGDDALATWTTGQGASFTGSSSGLTQPPLFVQNTNSNDGTSSFFFGSPNLGTNNTVWGFFGKSPGSLNMIAHRFTWVANSSTSNRYSIFFSGGSEVLSILGSGNIGIGVVAPASKLHVLSTTEQIRAAYDASNYFSTTVASDGGVTNNAVGSGAKFNYSDSVNVTGHFRLTTAGNKIKIATGSNASVGTATLSSGTITVSTTAVSSASLIFVTYDTPSGTLASGLSAPVGSIVDGTSFVINSLTTGGAVNTADNSTVRYWIIN